MKPEITTAHESVREKATCDAYVRLFDRYDLSSWRRTNQLVIDERAIPHSHPVLTIHTRHLGDEPMLLSVYVHEQLHWYLNEKPAGAFYQAVGELLSRYPDLPVGGVVGARNAFSSVLHYIVCHLEYASLIRLIGERLAQDVLARNPVYTEIYATVLRDYEAIGELIDRHGLGLWSA